MRATINHAGLLTIEPETPLEAYALGKWAQENMVVDGDKGYWKSDNMVISANCAEVGPPAGLLRSI